MSSDAASQDEEEQDEEEQDEEEQGSDEKEQGSDEEEQESEEPSVPPAETAEAPSLLARASRVALRHPFPVVPLAFYLWSVGPTIGLGDTALAIDGIKNLKINTHVNNHNITVLIGWLFSFLPVGNIAYRANLVSVFGGWVAISLFYALIYRIFRSRISAAITAAILMVSHSMWWHSTIIEVYAVNAVLMVVTLWCLELLHEAYRDRRLYALFFVSGLAFFNHVQMGILGVGATVMLVCRMATLIRDKKPAGVKRALRLFGGASAACAVGFAPYAAAFAHDASRLGFSKTLNLASGGDFKSIMFKGSVGYGLRELAFLVFQQFPSPALLAAAAGVGLLYKRWGQRPVFFALGAMFAVNTGFFMFYNTWDKFAFLLPSFIMLAFCAAHGIEDVRAGLARKGRPALTALGALAAAASLVWPPVFYAQLTKLWPERYTNDYTANTHDCASFVANPNKRWYTSVEDYANLLFEKLPRGAIYIDDDSRTYYPIWYFQKFYGKRPDVKVQLLNSWGFEKWGVSEKNFGRLLDRVILLRRQLFIVTTMHPFQGVIERTGHADRYHFEKFQLDERHWIYKLNTDIASFSTSGEAPALPVIEKLATGVGFNTVASEDKGTFQQDEQVMVELRFERNRRPFDVSFHWISPAGETVWKSDPFTVAPGNRNVWSGFDKRDAVVPGTWKVQAYAGTDKLGEATFEIVP